LKIPIDDTEKYFISTHFETVYSFIEEALNKNNDLRLQENEIIDSCEIECEKEEIQNILKSFKKLYHFDIGKTDNEIITGADIDKIQDLQIKNKICQILTKFYYNYNSNNRILIHCSMGVSRSPALVIMYLMKKLKLSFNSVINLK